MTTLREARSESVSMRLSLCEEVTMSEQDNDNGHREQRAPWKGKDMSKLKDFLVGLREGGAKGFDIGMLVGLPLMLVNRKYISKNPIIQGSLAGLYLKSIHHPNGIELIFLL